MDTITINKDLIPYEFEILLADDLFKLRIDYNNTADLFTVSLYKDDELICVEPIIYGIKLFQDTFQPDKYPALDIIPIDESGQITAVTFDNLCDTVLLKVDNGGENDE